MNEMVRVTDVVPLEGHWIRVTFTDGAVMDIGVGDLLAGGGVFGAIREDRQLFEQVRVNPESQTVEWPEEIDLDPDVLYGRFESARGTRYERRLIKQPSRSTA